MALIHETLSDQFYAWERRGRGWTVWPWPVSPEPPFRPFLGHVLPETPIIDDGRRPTFLSSFIARLAGSAQAAPEPPPIESEEEPEPPELVRESVTEFQVSLPAKLDIGNEAFAQFLRNLSRCREPIAFELVGTKRRVTAQFAVAERDASLLRRQLEAHFPEAAFRPVEGALEDAWQSSESEESLVVEFGLEREFMFPLATGKLDAFVGIVGALSDLKEGEVAVFQVIFEPLGQEWAESIVRSVTGSDGKPFFVNFPELAKAGENKARLPLYAAVVRIAIKAESFDESVSLARDLAGSLAVFENPLGNRLIPLSNEEYPFDDHVEDFLRRQSRRSGMILGMDEFTGFVHLPTSAVRSAVFSRETEKTKAARAIARNEDGLFLGENVHFGASIPVFLTPDERSRHIHVIGASGTGKSTLLLNLIRQAIQNGEGLAVLDPHGDLVDEILSSIPEERIGGVILIDPSDEEYSVGFNILSAHSDLEKNLLSSDLVSVFQRLSTSWGDQMGIVLQNAILAFLESDEGGTLSDMRRFLIEPAYRERFLKTVLDPDIRYYWSRAFKELSGNRSIGPVVTRLETFLAPKPIRYMVAQKTNRLDFARIMDEGKIFLAKLPQGQIGKENSFLLGSLFVSKFQQIAMSRQAQRIESRRLFTLVIDEFQNFITPSMAEILSGARKYRLSLVLAHQELRQMERDREVSSAVLSNPYTRIVFRVGDADARALESGFSYFEAKDLQNLETGQAICRIERADGDFNLAIPYARESSNEESVLRKKAVIESSRKNYGTPRAEVEAALRARLDQTEEGPERKDKELPPPREKKKECEPEKKERSEEAQKAAEELSVQPLQTEEAADAKSGKAAELDGTKTQTQVRPEESPVVISEAARKALEEKPRIVEIPNRDSPQSRESGKGGAQHRILQRRIKEAAEAVGFDAVIEKEIPNSQQTFDVHLERNDLTIACEISFTTTVDWEIGNISKCLKAGVGTVAVICLEESRLKKIKSAVEGTFSPSDAARVVYFEPALFIAHIEALAPAQSTPVLPEKKRAGRTVRRTIAKADTEERRAREAEYNRAIAEALQKK